MRRVWGLLAVTLVGCVNTKPASKVSDACLVNSDCDTGLACVYRVCHAQCRIDADCSPDSRCFKALDPGQTLVCMLPSDAPEGGCRYNSECPWGTVCGRDLVCRNQCLTDVDCIPGQRCTSGLCAKNSELQVDGGLVAAIATPNDCSFYDSECPAPLICRDRHCIEACRDDRDCDAQETCAEVTCASTHCPRACRRTFAADASVPTGFGDPCDFSSQCRPGLSCSNARTCTVECLGAVDCGPGSCCLNYTCARGLACVVSPDGGSLDAGSADGGRAECMGDLQCQDGITCNGAERCVGGVCIPATRAACDDGNPCTQDLCNEALHSCSYASTVAADDDHDGHPPITCGGTADDCDDSNASVYPGAVERCDFIDNNCNGLVDENLWAERVGSRAPLTTQDLYGPAIGATRAAWLGTQIAVIAASDGTSRGTLDAWLLDPVTLSPQAGPIALGGSATLWDECVSSGSPLQGRRVAARPIGIAPAELFTAGFALNYANTNGCCAASSAIEFVSFFNTLGANTLTPPDAGIFSTTLPFLNGCDQPLWHSNRTFDYLGSVWNPHLSKWVVFIAQRASSTNDLLYALYDAPSRTLGTLRPVFVGNANEARSQVSPSNGEDLVAAAVGQHTMLVVWSQSAALRAIGFDARDPNLAQLTANPRTLPLPTPYFAPGRNVEIFYDGEAFVLATDHTINSPSAWFRVDESTLALGTPHPLNERQAINYTTNGSGVASGLVSPILHLQTGLVSAATTASGFRFLWGGQAPDAGTQWVDVPLNLTPLQHTDPALVALDARSVALFYADGNLKRLIMECVGPPAQP